MERQWNCSVCTLLNHPDLPRCEACGHENPVAMEQSWNMDYLCSNDENIARELQQKLGNDSMDPDLDFASPKSDVTTDGTHFDFEVPKETGEMDAWTAAEIEWAMVEADQNKRNS